jgi:D-alanyl-D-alanine carboxypeptidase (penicillin-binding protein 5/6)
MLPSGNDAAVALAEWGGRVLGRLDEEQEEYTRLFVNYMNEKGLQWGLRNSRWNNPHGLPDILNYSTAMDMAKMACLGLDDPRFARIVSCHSYEFEATSETGRSVRVEWENTNTLLQYQGFEGVKTGVTQSAGPCLVACYRAHGHCLVGVLLRSQTKESRQRDALRLFRACLKEWAREKRAKETVGLAYRDFVRMLKDEDSEEDSDE